MPFVKLSNFDCTNILKLFEEFDESELTDSDRRTRETVRTIQALQELKHQTWKATTFRKDTLKNGKL
jgi:hypothetical protein